MTSSAVFGGVVPAVERATAILRYLAEARDRGSCTVTQIARGTDLNKSTCSNILRTLEVAGLTEYLLDFKSYRLGAGLIGLAAKAAKGREFPGIGMSHLDALAARTGFTCAAFEQLPDESFVVVAKVDSTKQIKATIDTGTYFPPSAPAFGRLATAWLLPADAKAYWDRWGTPAFTDSTLTDRAALRRELDQVGKQGYSAIRGEYLAANTVIATRVGSTATPLCRGIFLVAFNAEISAARVPEIGRQIRQTALDITQALGE